MKLIRFAGRHILSSAKLKIRTLIRESTPPNAPSRQRFEQTLPRLMDQYCTGNGLEIGPRQHPYCDRKRTKLLDKHTSNKDGCPNPDTVGPAAQIPSPDESFDFVFSSHCLEHVPNTIKVLKEWIRVLRSEGKLFLILPHGDRTLDQFREKTTLDHHLHDVTFVGDATADPSHFEEMKNGWMKNPNFEQLAAEYEQQWGAHVWDFDFRIKNDVFHYHVWTQDELIELLQHLNLKILHVCDVVLERDDSFLIIAEKIGSHHASLFKPESVITPPSQASPTALSA